MNPFRMRSKRMEEPPGGGEGGGEYGSPSEVPGVPFDPTNPYAPGNAENPFQGFGPWNGPSANTNGGPDVIPFPEQPPNVAVKSTPDVGNPGVDINNPTWGPYTIAEPAAGRVKGWPDLPGANDEPGALPPDDAIAMPPEPMPWDANLGQKFPEGWDPLAQYLHDSVPSTPAPPDWLGGALGAAPWVLAGSQILNQWADEGNAKFRRWEQAGQDAAMDSGLPGAETDTGLPPGLQPGDADAGTNIFDPLSGQNAGMQELLADEEQRGNSSPPTEGPPYDSSDVTGVYDPVSGGVIDTTGGGSSDTPPQSTGNSAGPPYIEPTQPPVDQNQYDPFSYDGGGGGNGGGYQGAETNTGTSGVSGYSGPPDVGYRVGFIPNTGVNTGVTGGSGGGSGGGGGGVGGFPGDGGGGDMGNGSDTVADWLDWLFGGGGGSPHTGTPDMFGNESVN